MSAGLLLLLHSALLVSALQTQTQSQTQTKIQTQTQSQTRTPTQTQTQTRTPTPSQNPRQTSSPTPKIRPSPKPTTFIPSSAATKLATSSKVPTTTSVAATAITTAAATATANEGGVPTWAGNMVNAAAAVLNSFRNQTGTANSSSVAIGNLMSRLPGILQGLGGVDLRGNDVGKTLASLFGDPR